MQLRSRRPPATSPARWSSSRVAVGVVGAFVLGGFLPWRRRPWIDRTRGTWRVPDGSSATVATSLYGVAAAALALLSLDAFLVADGDGTGQWLSAAIVAAARRPSTGSRCPAPSSPEPGPA